MKHGSAKGSTASSAAPLDIRIYSIVQMYFILSRNTPKLLIVILLPAFCLVILSTFGLVVPIRSGEKLGYSVTVLLAFYVYKEAVEDMMAPWEDYDETPTLIGLFTGITMSMSFLSFKDEYLTCIL